jgi:hypothetical protein
VGQEGAVTTCEDSGEPPRFVAGRAVADREHAAVHRVQKAAADAHLDHAARHSTLDYLCQGDDPMMRRGELADREIDGVRGSVEFATAAV